MRLPRGPSAILRWVPVLAVVLTGCRADVRVEIDVNAEGGASTGVVVHLDEAAVDWLTAADVDAAAIVSGAAVDPWRFERGPGDGLELWLRRDVDDAAELGDVLRGLGAGLTADDPTIVLDLEVQRPDRRTTRLVGSVEPRPAGSAALLVDGHDVGPGADELAELAREFVTVGLVVRLPGEVVAHDGDRTGDGVRFDLMVGERRSVSVESRSPAPSPTPVAMSLVGLGAAALVGAGVALSRARSRRRRPADVPGQGSPGA